MDPPVLILDGGLGTSLESKYSVSFSRATPLWSSDLLVSDPATLLACQSDFAAVPVDILLTATYQVSLHAFEQTRSPEFPEGIPRASVPRFIEAALSIAHEALAKHANAGARVALSYGPYGACMIPSQEYSGAYDVACDDEAALEAWHRARLQLFGEAADIGKRVDFVALETIPRVDEIRAMRKALESVPALAGLPYWMSILSPGEELALPDGGSIEAAVEAMLDSAVSPKMPWGIGINCTKVHQLEKLVAAFEAAVDRLIRDGKVTAWPCLLLYPDGTNGEVYNTTTQKWEVPEHVKGSVQSPWEEQLGTVVEAIRSRGRWPQVIVGGCCRASSEDIKRLKDRLQQ